MYTHITVVLDRTGSMEPIRGDIIGGFNSFLAEQRKVAGTRITLIQFDSQNPHEVVYADLPISEARDLTLETYVPRAMTPLYDAVGRAILETESHRGFSSNPEIAFAKTIFVIITDGQENASKEYNPERVRQMIEEKKKDGWEFVFLSADLNSFAQATAIGIPAANAMAYDHTGYGTRAAFRSLSANTVSYSSGNVQSMMWDDDQRSEQESDTARRK